VSVTSPSELGRATPRRARDDDTAKFHKSTASRQKDFLKYIMICLGEYAYSNYENLKMSLLANQAIVIKKFRTLRSIFDKI
jgi:hypothetical protein